MAKKKQHDDIEDTLTTSAPDTQAAVETSPCEISNGQIPLMDEIQTFMSMRDELAQKLAAEIEAAERRLEELKSTAAALFPQNNKPIDDKKAKKPKPKPSKEEKVAVDSVVES